MAIETNMIELPASETPLYNHTLPSIEQWLRDRGCQQDESNLHCWYLERTAWKAEICLEIEELRVIYWNLATDEQNIVRSFKYSLSRQDIEDAVFSGP
jgi:Protein of unknown function (DUF3143)